MVVKAVELISGVRHIMYYNVDGPYKVCYKFGVYTFHVTFIVNPNLLANVKV